MGKSYEAEFRHAKHDFYLPPTEGSDVTQYAFDPSMARQEFAAECDINTIMARYEKTGQLPMLKGEPRYLDLSSAPSTLMETLQVLDDAQDAFMRLPAIVRREFDNDPVRFAEFAMQGENLEVLREWGLAKPASPVAPGEPGAAPAAAPGAVPSSAGSPAASAAGASPAASSAAAGPVKPA